jgi:hypothetical protein
MIAFATAVTDRRLYETIALPGIQRVAEPDSPVLTREGRDSIQRPYNEMLDEAAELSGIEALVLLHQDVELEDEALCGRIRRAFRDRRVGLFGVLGARVSKLHRWLSPDEVLGMAIGPEHLGPEWLRLSIGPQEVDMVDGAVLVLAPWVIRGLRFDETLPGGFHGYDVDISMRVRAHGGKVICEDVECRHHAVVKLDFEAQRDAGLRLARMWDPTLRPSEWRSAFQP